MAYTPASDPLYSVALGSSTPRTQMRAVVSGDIGADFALYPMGLLITNNTGAVVRLGLIPNRQADDTPVTISILSGLMVHAPVSVRQIASLNGAVLADGSLEITLLY